MRTTRCPVVLNMGTKGLLTLAALFYGAVVGFMAYKRFVSQRARFGKGPPLTVPLLLI